MLQLFAADLRIQEDEHRRHRLRGTLDGQARSSWVTWQAKTLPGTIDLTILRKMGAEGVPVEQRIFYGKPSLIQPVECRNILVEGINVRDYPWWCIHMTYCTNVTVRNVTIVDASNPNNDGCDADSCTDMLIENCRFNTRDDSVCVKAGRDQDGWRVGKPSQNIIIRNMTDWHGLAIGSDMSGGIQNVFLQNCSMGRGAAVYMKSNLDRGGFIRNIYVKDIKIDKGTILKLRNNYHGYRGGNYPADFRDIFVENVTIKEANSGAIFVAGVKGAPVKNVFIKNSTVEKATEPVAEIQYAENVVLDNVYANGKLQPTHPKPISLAKRKIDGVPSITPVCSGKWSETAIWNIGRDGGGTIWNGAPAGRLPDGTKDIRVLIGKKEATPAGVTVILDMDIDDTYEVRIYEKSALVIPSGRTLKIGSLRPDRTNTMVRQTGGNLICPRLHIDDVSCQYLITGGYMQVATLLLDEGSLTIDDSAATIKSISITDVFQAGSGTTITFAAHAGGLTPIQCKDVKLTGYLGQHLIVDVSEYDYAANGDLTLVSYTGTRTGKFDGGLKKPGPQVTIIGAKADIVYDDAGKKIKLTNFRP